MASVEVDFTIKSLKKGADFCKKKIVGGEKLHNIIMYFDMPSGWIKHRRILGTLELFEDDDDYTNNQFVCDIEELVLNEYTDDLEEKENLTSQYIFQLIEYIKHVRP